MSGAVGADGEEAKRAAEEIVVGETRRVAMRGEDSHASRESTSSAKEYSLAKYEMRASFFAAESVAATLASRARRNGPEGQLGCGVGTRARVGGGITRTRDFELAFV